MKIAIAGSTGRMGRMLIEAILNQADLQLAAALEHPASPALGQDCAATLGQLAGIRITADLQAIAGADVLIDFTRPAATLAHVEACTAAGIAMVIGTTGFTPDERTSIDRAAAHIPIVLAPNMSVGVQAALRLIDLAARLLDDSYDAEIVEMHHRHKVDAPSGTALRMGEVVAKARGVAFDHVCDLARQGHTGARTRGHIGFAALRGGDVIGDHTVIFAADGERIEITHRSSSRAHYAQGALRAARFLRGRAPGLYDMNDVIESG